MSSTLILGCGYLGRRVGGILAERGEIVHGTTRSPEKIPSFTDLGIRPVLANVLDPADIAALPDADRVFLCISHDRQSTATPHAVHVGGLRGVLERYRTAGLRRVVHASTTGVYAQNDGDWVDEDSPAGPTSESGRAHLEAENLLLAMSKARGLSTVSLRFSGLYGPGRIPAIQRIERGLPISGNPEHWLNLIHIEDAALCGVAALDHIAPPSSRYVATDDRPVRRREFYHLVSRLLGLPEARFERPPRPTGRDGSNKRAANERIRRELGLELQFPSIDTGLPAALGQSPGPRHSGAGSM